MSFLMRAKPFWALLCTVAAVALVCLRGSSQTNETNRASSSNMDASNSDRSNKWESLPEARREAFRREAGNASINVKSDSRISTVLKPIAEGALRASGATNAPKAEKFAKAAVEICNVIDKVLADGLEVQLWNGRHSATVVQRDKTFGFTFWNTNYIVREVIVRDSKSRRLLFKMNCYPEGQLKSLQANGGDEGIELYANGDISRYWRSAPNEEAESRWDGAKRIIMDWAPKK